MRRARAIRAGSAAMRAALACAALACASGLVLCWASCALAEGGDGASTSAYVQANYLAVRTGVANLAASEAGPRRVLAQIKRECPLVGSGSPQDAESTQMSDEVIGAMVKAAIQPDLGAIRSAVRTALRLHWSDPALTREIHAYAGKWKTVLELPTPNLCADVRAWGASGYRALPATTRAFAPRFMAAWVAPGYLPRGLSRYESAAANALARRSAPLEEDLSELEAREVAHYGEIMNELAIWP
jgi:hypothetical protein